MNRGVPTGGGLRPLASLGVVSLGHMLNDLYSNFLPQMLPFLVVLLPGFTPSRAALLVAAFSLSSSVFQPIFGYVVDSKGKSWLIYLGTLWMSAFLSPMGLVDSYPLMVLLAVIAGLGTSAFHPPASALVHGLNSRRKAVYQSIFVAFGNIGFALAPLLLVPLFQAKGLRATWLLILPGLLATALLFFALPRQEARAAQAATLTQAWASLQRSGREMSLLLAVIMLRSAAYTGLLALLPLYFQAKGTSNIAGSRLLTLMLAAGAVGGVAGGLISDRFGRKPLTAGSLMAATPLFVGFLTTRGALSMVLLSLAGACLLASFSVTTVAAQELIPRQKALAAGLSLGFSNGLGALAAILIGRLADTWGLTAALGLLSLLPAAAGLMGLALRNNRTRVPSEGDWASRTDSLEPWSSAPPVP